MPEKGRQRGDGAEWTPGSASPGPSAMLWHGSSGLRSSLALLLRPRMTKRRGSRPHVAVRKHAGQSPFLFRPVDASPLQEKSMTASGDGRADRPEGMSEDSRIRVAPGVFLDEDELQEVFIRAS